MLTSSCLHLQDDAEVEYVAEDEIEESDLSDVEVHPSQTAVPVYLSYIELSNQYLHEKFVLQHVPTNVDKL